MTTNKEAADKAASLCGWRSSRSGGAGEGICRDGARQPTGSVSAVICDAGAALFATSAQGHRPCTCGSEATPKAPEPHQRNSLKDDRRSTCGEIAAFPQKFWRPYRNKQRLPSPC